MGEATEMQGPQGSIAKGCGIAPIECRRFHPCGMDAAFQTLLLLFVLILHWEI